jgi:GDPmannose 4,6-dehydratase
MTRKTAFVTGVTGQDGAYLAQIMLDKGYEVYGGVRRTSNRELHRLKALGIEDHVKIVEFELTDPENIARVVREHQPTHFYNLAAQSFVGSSWSFPTYTSQADGMGVLSILEAIRNYSPETRFYQASTSEMFGLVQAVPQSETTPFYPRSPYGVAKLFAHWMTKNYRESFGLFATSGILFNHESPLRGTEFVTRKITLSLARIAHGQQDVLELGNMDAKRDWGYAKEYVECMATMLEAGESDDFVLATGETHTVRDFVNAAAGAAGMDLEWNGEAEGEYAVDRSSGKTIVKVNSDFYRPAEVELLVGDASKAKDQLGWSSSTSMAELSAMMYREDHDRVAQNRIFF